MNMFASAVPTTTDPVILVAIVGGIILAIGIVQAILEWIDDPNAHDDPETWETDGRRIL